MTTVSTATAAPERAGRPAASLYRAVWRWHFYAGLITLPFLILLAVTGGLSLFPAEIDGLIHRDVKRVEARMTGERPPSEIVAQAVKAFPGKAVKYLQAETATASAEVTVRNPAGTRMVVYVDPYDARVFRADGERRPRNRRGLGDRAGAGRPLAVVAAQAERRRCHGPGQAAPARVLARSPCGYRPRCRRLHPVPRDHRHALVGALGRQGQSMGQRP